MDSKGVSLFLSLNLLFFSMIGSFNPSFPAQNDDPSSQIRCPDLIECSNVGLGVSIISNQCCTAVAALPIIGGAFCFCRAVSLGILPPLATEILAQILFSACGRNNTIFDYNCQQDQEQNMHVSHISIIIFSYFLRIMVFLSVYCTYLVQVKDVTNSCII